jgi:hypothetical protein
VLIGGAWRIVALRDSNTHPPVVNRRENLHSFTGGLLRKRRDRWNLLEVICSGNERAPKLPRPDAPFVMSLVVSSVPFAAALATRPKEGLATNAIFYRHS